MLRAERRSRDAGMTLIELMVAMAIFGIVCAIAVISFRSLTRSLSEQGTQREVVSKLRTIQTRSVAEDTTYCVDFGSRTTTDSWNVYKVPGADDPHVPIAASCSAFAGAVKVSGPEKVQAGTHITTVDFNQRDGSDTAFALFYPRGAATAGSFTVTRDNSSKTYTVKVEGLTARISSSGS